MSKSLVVFVLPGIYRSASAGRIVYRNRPSLCSSATRVRGNMPITTRNTQLPKTGKNHYSHVQTVAGTLHFVRYEKMVPPLDAGEQFERPSDNKLKSKRRPCGWWYACNHQWHGVFGGQ